MKRYVEHPRIGIEHVLGSVAVVCVVVNDHHALALRREMCRRDRNVGDDAEPHRLTDSRMVPWGAHCAERRRCPCLAPLQSLDGGESGARCKRGRLP